MTAGAAESRARRGPVRIIGNLDCDVDFAREDAALRAARGEKAPPPGDPRFALPAGVESSISALATLLRAFAREDDVLWTPRPVDPARMAEAPGLPRPRLESGPLAALPPAAELLAWGETREVERARAQAGPPGASIARQVNHRGFSLELARSLGLALPGAEVLGSLVELEAHLARGGASASPGERWVLKAPHSAAGRSRLRGAGRALDPSARRRAERLFELFGVLIFEPWMDRNADFGCASRVDDGGFRSLGTHVLEVDVGGGFRGIRLGPVEGGGAFLRPDEESQVLETAAKVGKKLGEAGYRGPFGIDSWRYRDREGRERLNPLGEINARMTFGLVARAVAERVRGNGGGAVTLRVGRRAHLEALPSGGAWAPLLLPGREDPTAAWLEWGTAPELNFPSSRSGQPGGR